MSKIDFTRDVVLAAECFCANTDNGGICEWCDCLEECDFLTCPQCGGLYNECPCPGPTSDIEDEDEED